MEAWFISDLHLKSINERNGQKLLRFLFDLKEKKTATHLYLLGDIFDVWVGGSDHFRDKFSAIIDALNELKSQNVKLTYFEGNHDVHIKPFWRDQLGFEVFTEPEYVQVGKWTLRLEHGDLMNPNDRTYLNYRKLIRSQPVQFLGENLPGVFWDWIATNASQKSRANSDVYRHQMSFELRKIIRDYAEKSYRQKKFDYLISGHVHFREDVAIHDGSARLINLGTWLDQPGTFRLNEQEGSWLEL